MQTVIGEIQKEFFLSLEKEIERTSSFFSQLAKNIVREINSILKNRDQWRSSHDHFLTAIIDNQTKIGNQVIEICHFIELNMTALRKILKKFDKQLSDISIPMAQMFLNNLMKYQNSNFVAMVRYKVLYEIFLILEDSQKFLRKITVERMNYASKKQNKRGTAYGRNYDYGLSQVRQLTQTEELKKPLLEDESENVTQMIPEGLGSQDYHRVMLSKLKMLKNTLDILDESLVAIKYSTSFVLATHQAQVMIETYKDSESQEGLMYSLSSSRNKNEGNNDDDQESSEGKDDESYNSSFNLQTLNLQELKRNEGSRRERFPQKELLPGGDYVSLNLLYVQAFLYTFNHFLIVPPIFEFAHFLSYTPTIAGFLLAMTSFATSLHAIVQNLWTRRSFKNPLLFGIAMILFSNLLYIYSFHQQNMYFLLASRFIFGFGGSKVVHRQYIANFVCKSYWTKYYNRLILISFLGMSFGPICYILMIKLNIDFRFQEQTFVLPGYVGFFLFSFFFLIASIFFKRQSKETLKKRERSLRIFKENTTSNYSLDSFQSDQEQLQQKSEDANFEHYNEKLREISELKGFWSKYGSYIILIILKFFQKVTQDALIVILPVMMAIVTESTLPLEFSTLSYVCLIYSAMGIIALVVNHIVGRFDLSFQDRGILLFSLFAASCGVFLQIDMINQGSIWLHMFGFAITFIGIEIMEVSITTLTAKFTPPNLLKGLLNPSFLLTFAGTIGRTIGCLTITLADLVKPTHQTFEHITNLTFIPLLFIYLIMFVMTNCIYEQLKSVSFYQFQTLNRRNRQPESQYAQTRQT